MTAFDDQGIILAKWDYIFNMVDIYYAVSMAANKILKWLTLKLNIPERIADKCFLYLFIFKEMDFHIIIRCFEKQDIHDQQVNILGFVPRNKFYVVV